MNGTEASYLYAFKSSQKNNPYKFLLTAVFLSVLIPGYGLRIAERPMDEFSGLNFTDLGNCIWCIIVTITTVGYGDYYAVTNLGRTWLRYAPVGIISLTVTGPVPLDSNPVLDAVPSEITFTIFVHT